MSLPVETLKKGFSLSGTNSSLVILIHGFGGTPAEHYRTALALQKAGYAIEAPLLAGHGTAIEDLDKTKWQEFVQGVDNLYLAKKDSYEKVHVVGLSMGGLVALELMERHPEIASGAFMAPALVYKQWYSSLSRILWPFKKHLPFYNQFHLDPESMELLSAGYSMMSVHGGSEMTKMQHDVKKNLKKITAPVIVFYCAEDELVSKKTPDLLLRRVSSTKKEKVLYPDGGHVISLDRHRDEVFAQIIAFFGE